MELNSQIIYKRFYHYVLNSQWSVTVFTKLYTVVLEIDIIIFIKTSFNYKRDALVDDLRNIDISTLTIRIVHRWKIELVWNIVRCPFPSQEAKQFESPTITRESTSLP